MSLNVGARVRHNKRWRYGNVIHVGNAELKRYLIHWDSGLHSWCAEGELRLMPAEFPKNVGGAFPQTSGDLRMGP